MWNVVLLGLALVVCVGGAYYKFSEQQKELVAAQTQTSDLQDQLKATKDKEQKSEDQNKALTTQIANDKTDAAGLTAKLQTTLAALNDKEKALDLALHPPPKVEAAPPPPPPDPNDLGTITTLNQKTYLKCHLLKVDAQGITVNHSAGITKILFGFLTPDLQKHFGFDSATETALTDDQVQAAETARMAGPESSKAAAVPADSL